jgi:hypothetical protein
MRRLEQPLDLSECVERSTGIRVHVDDATYSVKFGVTKFLISLNCHLCRDLGGEIIPHQGILDARFVTPTDLEQLSMSSPMRKVAHWAIAHFRLEEPGPAKETITPVNGDAIDT